MSDDPVTIGDATTNAQSGADLSAKEDSGSELSKASRKRARRSAARLSAVQALYQMDIAHTDLNQVIHEFTYIRSGRADAIAARDAAEAEAEASDAKSKAEASREPKPPLKDPSDISVIGTADHTFFAEILRGVVRLQTTIDPEVDKQLAQGWRLARVDSILRQTLRAAAFELIDRTDVPTRVVITEYIEIAKAFFDGDEPKVVNAVLDQLAQKFRAGGRVSSEATDEDNAADDPALSERTEASSEPKA